MFTNARKTIPLLAAIMCAQLTQTGCASLLRLKHNLFSPVTVVVADQAALHDKTCLVLKKISSKNGKSDDALTTNFRDNLRFELLRTGFRVDLQEENKNVKRSTLEGRLILHGYIFQARTGELLDETVTTGVYLGVDLPHGKTAAHLRYIGRTSLGDYSHSAEVGRLFAGQLKRLTQARTQAPWWNFQ